MTTMESSEGGQCPSQGLLSQKASVIIPAAEVRRGGRHRISRVFLFSRVPNTATADLEISGGSGRVQ